MKLIINLFFLIIVVLAAISLFSAIEYQLSSDIEGGIVDYIINSLREKSLNYLLVILMVLLFSNIKFGDTKVPAGSTSEEE